MIQIDDAGSGSLIGGTCIAAIRVETLEFYYDIIPIEYYHKDAFEAKCYLNKCEEIVFELLDNLNVNIEEEIQICRGYMFDTVRKKLMDRGYNITSTKIDDPLQTKVENAFQEYAIDLGLPVHYIKYTKYPFHFHRILRWVYADYEKRKKLCKTGWKSWQKYGHLDVKTYSDILYNNTYNCLKCGKHIDKYSKVKVIEYVSNCPNVIYLHYNCK